jgi:hypothetical protein
MPGLRACFEITENRRFAGATHAPGLNAVNTVARYALPTLCGDCFLKYFEVFKRFCGFRKRQQELAVGGPSASSIHR